MGPASSLAPTLRNDTADRPPSSASSIAARTIRARSRGAGPACGSVRSQTVTATPSCCLTQVRYRAELAEAIATSDEDIDGTVGAYEEHMWARAGRWAKMTAEGLERLVSPDPSEALALFDAVNPS